MPPWPSRFTSLAIGEGPSGRSTSSSSNNSTTNTPADKAAHNMAFPPVSPPRHGNNAPAAATAGQSSSPRQQAHTRAVSHPLPKIFGRKKSGPSLGLGEIQVPPLDHGLVPVFDDSPGALPPNKHMSARKRADDGDLATRHCMCCDNKVRFPRGLKVFRCTSCLTVNDLEPHVKDARDHHAQTYPGQQHASRAVLPLSVERSRAIIDRCLLTYLEARCSARNKPLPPNPPSNLHSASSSNIPSTSSGNPPPNSSNNLPPDPFVRRPSAPDHASPLPPPPPLLTASPSASPLPPPPPLLTASPSASPVQRPSATIKGPDDFTPFTLSAPFRTPPSPQKTSPRPRTASHQNGIPPVPPVPSVPPMPPSRRPPPPPNTQSAPPQHRPAPHPTPSSDAQRYDRVKVIFKPLEDYMLSSLGDYDCLNTSFSSGRQHPVTTRRQSESAIKTPPPEPAEDAWPSPMETLSQMDAKTLLIGDFMENGDWWTGRVARNRSDKSDGRRQAPRHNRLTTSKSPLIDWDQLSLWYETIHTAGIRWRERVGDLKNIDEKKAQEHLQGPINSKEIDDDIAEARMHAQRALLKITENILKRPSRPLTEPEHVRFIFVILANPSLYPSDNRPRAPSGPGNRPANSRTPSGPYNAGLGPQNAGLAPLPGPSPRKLPTTPTGGDAGQHAGILKRIFGLVAKLADVSHRCLINWLGRLPERLFVKFVDLVARFVTYRLSRRKSRPRSTTLPQDGGLIPDLSGSARNTFAQLQSATGLSGSGSGAGKNKMPKMETQSVVDYSEDWQIKAAAKVMGLLFAANNSWQTKRAGTTPADTTLNRLSRPRTKMHGQLLPTSDFYNTLLDYHDLVADFKAWESKKAKFTFCQYPLFLSMGAKIKLMEYDARRQMEIMAREAYFDSVTTHRAIGGYFNLKVRRDCMVDDSLKQISEAVGSGPEELKKGLRVHFTDEEGVDAGGLRKEWFLTVVRDIFDPNHGMFLYDEDSGFCYFNPSSFETSDQFYLVGAIMGLAIYNITILDVALPPFAFRKLLASAPASAQNPALPTAGARGQMTYTIEDLAEYRPALAKGLRDLLEYDGSVEATYCRDFVASVERYGIVTEVPLCPGGEKIPVTNDNRAEYVDAYIRYLLDTSITRQFEPFKRGFFTVCAGNALSLFRAEEIELMVRGSDEALDVDSLKAVAVYENWRSKEDPKVLIQNPAETVPVISWFWDVFRKADPVLQRKLLGFITGSDRIPATGAANLVLRIVCGGDGTASSESRAGGVVQRGAVKQEAQGRDGERFPIARTCFNMLVLWGYESEAKLEEKLWRAVAESEGFGLK